MFFSSDTSVTENITHFPLGEICGSLTRFIACKSANVIGLFAASCATATPAITKPHAKIKRNLIAPVYLQPPRVPHPRRALLRGRVGYRAPRDRSRQHPQNLSPTNRVYPREAMKLLLTLALLATAAQAQSGFGTLDTSQPTGIAVPQIIQKMGAVESEFEAARQQYTYRQTVKMDTISEDTNKPDGEYQQVADITFDDQGRRTEHVVFAPQNTIERVIMTENDLKDIEQRLPFVLTTEQLPQYDLTYLGKQKVDDLDTYVFGVEPKELIKGQRYLSGKVWVDQQDLEIVLVNGINVPQDTRKGHEDLSPPFTTYYQQIDDKYWFPTYTKAEGNLHFAAQRGALSQDVHMRTTVRYTDYKRFHTNVTIKYNGQDITPNKDDATPPSTGQADDPHPMKTPPQP